MVHAEKGSRYLLLKLSALGDISFFLPVVDQIRKRDPKAHITWVIGRGYADWVSGHPGVNHVVSVDESRLFSSSWKDRFWEIVELWRRIDFFRYDRVWIGHRTLGAFLLIRLRVIGRIFQLVRRPSAWGRLFKTEVVIPPLTLHEGLAFKKLTEAALGDSISPAEWKSDFSWVPVQSRPFSEPYLVIHLGGGSNVKTEFRLKRWPHWNAFIKRWVNESKVPVILVGAPGEQAEVEEALRDVSRGDALLQWVGKTKLPDLVDVIRSAHFFVGVDSGPLHLADAVGTPCLGLFGPTSPISWGTLSSTSQVLTHPVPCSPCYRDDGVFPECPYDLRCMVGLSVDDVFTSVTRSFSK